MSPAKDPSVTDNARAEAVREADLWLNTHRVNDTWRTMNRLRDELVRAAGRAETTTDNLGDAYMLGFSAAKNAETTTATDEDAGIDAVAHHLWSHYQGSLCGLDGCRYQDGEADADYECECPECWTNAVAMARGLADAHLLATARTRPTEDVPLLEDEDGAPYPEGVQQAHRAAMTALGASPLTVEDLRRVHDAGASLGTRTDPTALAGAAEERGPDQPFPGKATDLDRLAWTLNLGGIWDASVPPGGAVCPWCGDPWESEPSCEHAQAVLAHNDVVGAEALEDAAEDRELANLAGKPYARLYDARWLRERAARLRAGEQP